MRFESEIFRTGPSPFVRLKLWNCLFRWLWVFVAVYALLVWLSLHDVRFVYVGLMVTFIIWPMLLTFGWFWAVGSPGIIRRSGRRSMVVDSGGICFRYYSLDENNQEAGYVEDIHIPYSGLTSLEYRGDYIQMCFGSGLDDVDLIPAHILPAEVLDYVRSAMPGKDDGLA